MDLAKHYESYKRSLLKDALGESAWYSKQIRTNTGEPVFDWLSRRVETIKEYVATGAELVYKSSIERHQEAMIHLFEAMVEDHLWDYKLCGPEQLLDLIDDQGCNWFKFAKRHLKFNVEGTPMVWVPRYVYPWAALGTNGTCVAFDADELYVLRRYPAQAKRMFLEKQASPGMKIFATTPNASYLKQKPWLCNTESAVNDWTAPLFIKPEDMQA